MDKSRNEQVTRVSELILPDDNLESVKNEENVVTYIPNSSRSSPILGHHFKLPDLTKSFDPDPPTLDSSLPYIPVYTHLKTFELSPIERPKTPPLISKLRSRLLNLLKYERNARPLTHLFNELFSGSIQTKNCSKSRHAPLLDGRIERAPDDQAEPSTNRSEWIVKYEDTEGTFQDEST